MDASKPYVRQSGGLSLVYSDMEDISKYMKNSLTSKTNLNVLLGSGSSLPAIPVMGSTFEDFKKN